MKLHELCEQSGNGLISRNDAIAAGISRSSFTRLQRSGEIQELTRGLYKLPTLPGLTDRTDIDNLDFIGACKRFGEHAFITGPTALSHYNLIDSDPAQIWVSVPQVTRSTDKLYRLIRTNSSSKIKVIANRDFRIASVERAIVDVLRLRRIFPRELGFAAANNAISRGDTDQRQLLDCARRLKCPKHVLEYLGLMRPEAYGKQ